MTNDIFAFVLYAVVQHYEGPRGIDVLTSRVERFVEVTETYPGWNALSDDAQKIIGAIAVHESRLKWDAIGDGGRSFGAFQLRRVHWWAQAKDAAVFLASSRIQLDVVEKTLATSLKACPGTWENVLSAYASGGCGLGRATAKQICTPIQACAQKAVLYRDPSHP